MKSQFAQKTVIITGSSMGIGKVLALNLAKLGANVVINARSVDKLRATETEMKEMGLEVLAIVGDITLESDCRRLIDGAVARFGRIDILINNAGISMRGSVETLTPQVIAKVFNCNAVAPYMLSTMAMPFIKQNKGSVVFISTLAALRGLPYLSVYGSAKMALKGLAESLRIEHLGDNIHVGLIYIGITKIDQNKTALASNGETINLDRRDGLFAKSIEDVAKNIVRNIVLRKQTTIIGVSGKVYYFMVRFMPLVLSLIIKYSHKRLKKLYS